MTSIPKAVREQVRQRAGARCEYCLKPEGVSQFGHTVDHIVALYHEGTSELDNLAWSCFQCNSSKSSNVASYDNKVLTPLYNPRTQQWDAHFELDGAVMIGKTAVGRVTIRTLQMNHPDQIETRFRVMRAGRW